MSPRLARLGWVALGATAYPFGVILGHALFRRSMLYPH